MARDGVEFVREARALGCRRPLVLLTGLADRRVDLAATAAGATGFLLKHEASVSLLERTIRYALSHKVALATAPLLAGHMLPAPSTGSSRRT